MLLCLSRLDERQTADKKNLDNWTIDNDPEDSLKEKIQNGYQIEIDDIKPKTVKREKKS